MGANIAALSQGQGSFYFSKRKRQTRAGKSISSFHIVV